MSESTNSAESTEPPPRQPSNLLWIKLDPEEKERIQRMRDIILAYAGVFGFAEASQNLFCNVCKQELPYHGVDSLANEVALHVNNSEHVKTLASYIEQETSNLNKSLANAISEGVFQQMYEGLVKCTVCEKTLNDSLSNLKRHLLCEEHKLAEVGIKCGKTSAPSGYGPVVGKKLISLVTSNSDIEFASSDDGRPKVRCIKCDQLLPRDHNDVLRHLQCKRHTNETRKKRGPNKAHNKKRPVEQQNMEENEENQSDKVSSAPIAKKSKPTPRSRSKSQQQNSVEEPAATETAKEAESIPREMQPIYEILPECSEQQVVYVEQSTEIFDQSEQFFVIENV